MGVLGLVGNSYLLNFSFCNIYINDLFYIIETCEIVNYAGDNSQ